MTNTRIVTRYNLWIFPCLLGSFYTWWGVVSSHRESLTHRDRCTPIRRHHLYDSRRREITVEIFLFVVSTTKKCTSLMVGLLKNFFTRLVFVWEVMNNRPFESSKPPLLIPSNTEPKRHLKQKGEVSLTTQCEVSEWRRQWTSKYPVRWFRSLEKNNHRGPHSLEASLRFFIPFRPLNSYGKDPYPLRENDDQCNQRKREQHVHFDRPRVDWGDTIRK